MKRLDRCVVLVDEYDKSLLDVMDNPDLFEHNEDMLKGFFDNLKSCDLISSLFSSLVSPSSIRMVFSMH